MVELQSGPYIPCKAFGIVIATDIKVIALQAAIGVINIAIAFCGTLANGLVIMAY